MFYLPGNCQYLSLGELIHAYIKTQKVSVHHLILEDGWVF